MAVDKGVCDGIPDLRKARVDGISHSLYTLCPFLGKVVSCRLSIASV